MILKVYIKTKNVNIAFRNFSNLLTGDHNAFYVGGPQLSDHSRRLLFEFILHDEKSKENQVALNLSNITILHNYNTIAEYAREFLRSCVVYETLHLRV